MCARKLERSGKCDSSFEGVVDAVVPTLRSQQKGGTREHLVLPFSTAARSPTPPRRGDHSSWGVSSLGQLNCTEMTQETSARVVGRIWQPSSCAVEAQGEMHFCGPWTSRLFGPDESETEARCIGVAQTGGTDPTLVTGPGHIRHSSLVLVHEVWRWRTWCGRATKCPSTHDLVTSKKLD